jgi:hypothetical protein
MQINIEDTVNHETVHKLAHRADKANFSPYCSIRKQLNTSVAMHLKELPPRQLVQPIAICAVVHYNGKGGVLAGANEYHILLLAALFHDIGKLIHCSKFLHLDKGEQQ